jgi:TolB-like protein
MSLASGTMLGPYEILSPLGAGGMGEVYRARDTRLGREVAIKVLPASFSRDADRLRRFEQEARAASALNHPNILTIHDLGTQDGAPYAVAELLEGETLRERLAAGPLPAREAVGLAVALAQGLAAAHEKGIVHRDIKPENLFVTRDGRLKILDFGLARIAAGQPSATSAPTAPGTEPGMVLGTASYMSPEQVRGQPSDARSDIFSFGVVLYEMLSGRRPFRGDSPVETMNAILRDDPPSLEAEGDVSAALERILRRCLEKSAERRFQNARDLAFALESIAMVPSRGQAPAAAPGVEGARRSIAVLLFKDLAGDAENAHLGLGLADATITELAAMKSLLVRPTAAILRYRERPTDPETAGRELGVDAVVDGSFQRSGSKLRVTVQLVRTADGRSLWGAKIDTSLDDIFRMQDEVSRKIAEALDIELTPADERRSRRAGAATGRAYELYLKGRLELCADTTLPNVNAAIECFEGALELEPGFALAQLGLADAYTRMDFSIDPEGDWYARAEAMCQRALAVAADLPEGRYLRGKLLWHPRRGWDAPGAMREVSAAIVGRPGLNEAHHFLGQILNHLGLLREAEAAFGRALAIDPDDHYAQIHLGLSRYLQGRFAEALDGTKPPAARTPTPWSIYQIALCQLHLGRGGDALATLERLSRQFPGNVLLFSLRGLVAALGGDDARALEQIELVVRNRKLFGHYHHAQYDVACIEASLGNKAAALEWLTEASRNGFPCVPFFETDPWLEPLREEPGFQGLIETLKGEREGYRRLYGQLTATTP